MSEMTAIELLERDKWMLITLRDFYKQWLANAKANETDGMFLRDYFAGQAMQGLMSAHDSNGEWTVLECEKVIAQTAYRMADAMLNERAKQNKEIDADISSSPSERAKELVKDIRRTGADEAWHLTFCDAAHEIEEYAYMKNEELCKIMDEYENLLSNCRKALDAVESLIKESRGVYGLHLNGDPSPWEELRTGGCFEDWLIDFDTALSKLNLLKNS